jgi:hypothetical protein
MALQALIVAHEAPTWYGRILQSTRGIIFLATPHRGSDIAAWVSMFTNLMNAVSLGQALRNDLLRNLEKDSTMLMELSNQFVHRAASLKILSFTEQQIERPLNTLVV